MNVLIRPAGRSFLKKAVVVLTVLAATATAILLSACVTCLRDLAAAAGIPLFESEFRLLLLSVAGSAMASLALGMSIMTIYFLWRTSLQPHQPTVSHN
jgi:hypothetical protein